MKYKCLILDHDDTVVNSTATIHYPSFIAYLKEYRPDRVKNYTLESFIEKNFTPGILSLFRDELSLTDAELDEEQKFWESFVTTVTPVAYEGIGDIIREFMARGGTVAVSSHSVTRFILRDYEANGLPAPNVVYGWDIDKNLRKPDPYTVYDLIEKYGFDKSEMLMVDDLKPGFDMARKAGIDFAAAGWAYNVPKIKSFMTEHSDYYLDRVSDLAKILFEDN